MKKYVVIVRGKLKSKDEQAAQKAHDEFVAMVAPASKTAGALSHHAHLNPQNRNEFMAIDGWNNMESPMKLTAIRSCPPASMRFSMDNRIFQCGNPPTGTVSNVKGRLAVILTAGHERPAVFAHPISYA